MKLDEINRTILDILQRDAKQTAKKIAERVGLKYTPTYIRISDMEDAGVKKGM